MISRADWNAMSDEERGVLYDDQFTDEFGPYLDEALQEPGFRCEYEDTDGRQRLVDDLISLRKRRSLSQTEVARRMGIGQSSLSGFEKESSDPKLSTLQRYARAIGSRLRVEIVPVDGS